MNTEPTIDIKVTEAKDTEGNPVFNGVKVKLDGEWEKFGLFVDDVKTMSVDMEWMISKLVRKYVNFNKILGGNSR